MCRSRPTESLRAVVKVSGLETQAVVIHVNDMVLYPFLDEK